MFFPTIPLWMLAAMLEPDTVVRSTRSRRYHQSEGMHMIPIAGLTGVVEVSGFWQGVATFFGLASVVAQHRIQPERDYMADLMFRLRHPVRAAAAHPVATLRRTIDRRRQA